MASRRMVRIAQIPPRMAKITAMDDMVYAFNEKHGRKRKK